MVCLLVLSLLLAVPGSLAYAQIVPSDTVSVAPDDASLAPLMEEKHTNKPIEVKSLFFSDKEMVAIRDALAIYTKIIAGDDDALGFLRRLRGGPPKRKERYFVYPQFFLSSLAYHSDSDWSIRINGQLITNEMPRGPQDVHVVEIDKNKVTLEWMPENMSRVEQVWDVAPNDEVDVNVRSGVVMFTLKPNQTFSSYVMRILEGRVKPMVIDTAPESQDIKKPSLEPDKPESPPRSSGDIIQDLLNVVN